MALENKDYTGTTIMPFGKHKGKELQDVPAEYLIWYSEEARRKDPLLMEYIKDNWQGLLQEVSS